MSSSSSWRCSSTSSWSCSSSEEEEEEEAAAVGLERCGCCQALEAEGGRCRRGPPPSPSTAFLRLLRQRPFCRRNLDAAKLGRMLARQGSLEPVVRDPGFLRDQGLCGRGVDQTLLSILLFFHSASGASVVAIDNKIEQAMDLVKNHLMFAVREEVEVLKEQIKELAEKNSQLERENSLLRNLASPEQLQRFQSCLPLEGPPSPSPSPTSSSSAAILASSGEKQSALGPGVIPGQHRAGSAV
nr:TSC22 domain family protein 3 isoform X1 [Anolis sagrei ordinatus]